MQKIEFDNPAIRELQRLFEAELPQRIKELEQTLSEWKSAANTNGAACSGIAGDFTRQAHSLAGGAGSFQYPELYRLARALERRAIPLKKGGEQHSRTALSEIAVILQEIESHCALPEA